MSKIGKINITIPEKVKVALAGTMINIEGPAGKKAINIDLDTFDLDIDEDGILDLGQFNTQYNDSFEWFDWENFDFSDYLFS